MQGRAAGEPSATGPPRYGFINPKKRESDRAYRSNYTLNNNSAGLDLDSVWSIERNVKVKSSLSQPSNLNQNYKNKPGAQNNQTNFYSRYSNNSGDTHRSPSVPGNRGAAPVRRSLMETEPSDARFGSAHRSGSSHSGHSVGGDSRGGGDSNRGSANGPRYADSGEQKGFDPLADDFW